MAAVVGRYRVGIVADPDFPQATAEWLADKLPDELSDDREWDVEVKVDPIAAGQQHVSDILHSVSRLKARNEWDYAVCVTDLPLRRNRRPVLAEVNRDAKVAVISLPALGGLQPRRRARQMATQVLEELTTGEQAEEEAGASRRQLRSPLTRILAPIERTETSTDEGEIDVRYVATRKRGRMRLLSGMVRTNRPWRLIFGMSSALAAAVATSAFALSSSTIWQIAYELSPLREVIAAVLAVGVLVGWLIAAHGLWENASVGTAKDREQARLYNVSTVATLTIGVGCLYLGLFVINLAVAAFLVPPSLIASSISSEAATPSTYIALAWGFTTMGVVAGALGSSLESDKAVRQAAYGYREQQRRGQQDPQRQLSFDNDSTGSAESRSEEDEDGPDAGGGDAQPSDAEGAETASDADAGTDAQPHSDSSVREAG